MDADRWQRVQALFEEALALPDGEREGFLARACPDDPELRGEVGALIEADASGHSLLEAGASALLGAEEDREGTRVGPYRVVRRIGTGGMGAVYLAERADGQFAQQVALKLIKRGLDTEEILERFRSERQILAGLHHPNIARLLDGGVSEGGTPFFTMEYVHGEPIDAYCEREGLGLEERLGLFGTVCEAVQYAHRNLVVHRDIKPGNVMVTADGTVKLLDFGIAKVLAAPDAIVAAPGLTRPGFRVMTPQYASPEQIRGESVTTASDVYSLGLILYELITGVKPYDVIGRTPLEVEELVCRTVPGRPSTALERRLRSAGHAAPGRLVRKVSGDLDNICMMALRKEPDQRYGSAAELLADVIRYLKGLPVSARRDTLLYRSRKFLRRHRAGALASAAASVGLAGLIVFYTLELAGERDRARREAARLRAVSSFLAGLFAGNDPTVTRGRDLTAREILERGASRIDDELAGQPVIRASMLHTIGIVYTSLGMYDSSAAFLERSLQARAGAEPDSELVVTYSWLGEADRALGRYERADSMHALALGLSHELFGDRHPETAAAANMLAKLRYDQGDFAAAESLAREVLEIRLATLGPGDPAVALAINDIAWMRFEQGDFAGADSLNRLALGMRRSLYGTEHPGIAESLNNLGVVAIGRGDYEAAEPLIREGLAMRRRILGERHDLTLMSMNNLGVTLEGRGDLDEALEVYRRLYELRSAAMGEENVWIADDLRSIGRVLYARGDLAGARAQFTRALTMTREALGPGHWLVGYTLNGRARVEEAAGDLRGAERDYRASLAVYDSVWPGGSGYSAGSMLGLGSVLAQTGRLGEAEALIRRGSALFESYPDGHEQRVAARAAYGTLLAGAGRYEEAEAVLLEARTAMMAINGAAHIRTREIDRRLQDLYRRRGRPGGSITEGSNG